MRSKRFLSHLILTLSKCLKYKTRSRWEKFALSYNPFFRVVQITIRATARIARNTNVSHPETGEERCPRRNQHRAARAAWVRCEPSPPRRDPKTGELARNSSRRAQPFLPIHRRSEDNQACFPGPLFCSSQEGVTHSVQVARWERTRSCSRSSILAPNSSESGSPPPSSLAANEEDQKRNSPLVPDIVLSEAVKGHWTQEGYEGPFGTRGQTVLRPKAYVNLQPLGLTGGEEKYDSPFVSTLRPPSRIVPSMQVFQQGSGSTDQAYPDPRRVYVGYRPAYGRSTLHLPRAIWRGLVEVPTDVP